MIQHRLHRSKERIEDARESIIFGTTTQLHHPACINAAGPIKDSRRRDGGAHDFVLGGWCCHGVLACCTNAMDCSLFICGESGSWFESEM